MPGSVIVGGARTPIGKLSGALKAFKAVDFDGIAIKAALEKSVISGDQVDYVVMGHVIQAGAGQITARQAAVKGGIPMSVPAITVNKVCLSGLDAIALADQLIGCCEFDVVVAGGMESMINRRRHRHRRLGVADLQRRLRRGGDEPGPRPRSWAHRSCRDRRARQPGPRDRPQGHHRQLRHSRLREHPAALDKVIGKIPVGRLGEPGEVARVVEFLADPESSLYT
jgi:hypothetical protein